MPKHEIVYLFDVDNTLLDNDRVTADLKRYLEREVGTDRSTRILTTPVYSPFRRTSLIIRLPIASFQTRSMS